MTMLSPKEMAKQAAQAIRTLVQENQRLAADNAECREKLATLEKWSECQDLAKSMAARGQIDRSVDSVEKMARALLDKDLAVVKEAMTLAPSLVQLGEPVAGRSSAFGPEEFVEGILSMS